MKRFTSDRYLKISYLIGGIYDILLGISVLFLADITSEFLDVPKPDPLIMSQIIGVFLIVVGYFLIVATYDISKFIFIGAGSCIVRFSYAFLTVIAWNNNDVEAAYLFLASTDLVTGLLLLIPLLMTEGVSWKDLWPF
ncbi:MAG: hypothetical protein ACFFDT_24635 [Candidatus Hodarchaeota archaeon]